MKILNLVQGTPEWLEARLNHFTASEAPSMMGESKHMSRNELLALKKGWQSNPDSSFTEKLFQKGHDFEEAARELAECDLFEELLPVVGSIEVDGLLLLASFDGLTVDHVTAWEHKMWNATLAENVRNSVLEPHYYWQLEQQLLVSKADVCIFTVSDGTTENYVSMEYRSIPERREKLINGWKQFAIDLEAFEIKAKVEKVAAKETNALPVISCAVSGTEITTNATEYLALINERSAIEMERKLETDQDFADKELFNKNVKKARADLKQAVADVQGKFVSYSEFADTASQIDSILQKMQSHGEKQVKAAKDAKKAGIANEANNKLNDFLNAVDAKINPIQIRHAITVEANFVGAMKGKRTIESLQGAVDDELARIKVEVNEVADLIVINLKTLREMAASYEFLFNDTPQLVTKANEDLVNLIKSRITEHEAAEAQRKAEEREKIRLEEEEKARAKAEQEAIDKLHQEQSQASEPTVDNALNEVLATNEQASADKEVSPELAHMITAGNIAAAHKQADNQIATFGEYEPLTLWPSDHDVSQNDELARVCQKLEEAEAYIQMLIADKAA